MQNAAQQFIEANEAYERYRDNKSQEVVQKPEVVVTKQEALRISDKIKLVLCFGMVIMLIVLSLVHNVAVVELGDSIATQTNHLETLQESAALKSAEYERNMSILTATEELQGELLLGEAESYQIEYINLNDADSIEVTEIAQTESMVQRVVSTFEKLLEYMKES